MVAIITRLKSLLENPGYEEAVNKDHPDLGKVINLLLELGLKKGGEDSEAEIRAARRELQELQRSGNQDRKYVATVTMEYLDCQLPPGFGEISGYKFL